MDTTIVFHVSSLILTGSFVFSTVREFSDHSHYRKKQKKKSQIRHHSSKYLKCTCICVTVIRNTFTLRQKLFKLQSLTLMTYIAHKYSVFLELTLSQHTFFQEKLFTCTRFLSWHLGYASSERKNFQVSCSWRVLCTSTDVCYQKTEEHAFPPLSKTHLSVDIFVMLWSNHSLLTKNIIRNEHKQRDAI